MAKKQQEHLCIDCGYFFKSDAEDPPCPDCVQAYSILGGTDDYRFIEAWLRGRIKTEIKKAFAKAGR